MALFCLTEQEKVIHRRFFNCHLEAFKHYKSLAAMWGVFFHSELSFIYLAYLRSRINTVRPREPLFIPLAQRIIQLQPIPKPEAMRVCVGCCSWFYSQKPHAWLWSKSLTCHSRVVGLCPLLSQSPSANSQYDCAALQSTATYETKIN